MVTLFNQLFCSKLQITVEAPTPLKLLTKSVQEKSEEIERLSEKLQECNRTKRMMEEEIKKMEGNTL